MTQVSISQQDHILVRSIFHLQITSETVASELGSESLTDFSSFISLDLIPSVGLFFARRSQNCLRWKRPSRSSSPTANLTYGVPSLNHDPQLDTKHPVKKINSTTQLKCFDCPFRKVYLRYSSQTIFAVADESIANGIARASIPAWIWEAGCDL